MERLDPAIYDLAHQLRSFSHEDRRIISEALEIISSAVAAVRDRTCCEPREMGDLELARALKSFEAHTRESVAAALAVYDAVVTTLSDSKVRELHRFGQAGGDGIPTDRPIRVPPLQENAG